MKLLSAPSLTPVPLYSFFIQFTAEEKKILLALQMEL